MEKIYIENNNKNKSFFNRLIHSSISVKCSFLLALVTMFSVVFTPFVGGNGGTNTSYALPVASSSLPDTFTSKLGTSEIRGNISGFYVNDYYTNDNVQVFCLESDINFSTGTSYSKGQSITDYGLLYLMANSYPNVKFKTADGKDLDANLQTWITQVAIWIYQKEVGAANNSLSAETIEKIKTDTAVTVGDSLTEIGAGLGTGKTLYSEYIDRLVKAAIANRNIPNKSLKISFESDNVTLDESEKYYKTSLITVTGEPSDNFNGYRFELRNYPKGTMIFDENGNELDLTVRPISTVSNDTAIYVNNIDPGTKLYIKVPVDEITEENKTVDIYVVGSFTVYDGDYYVADGAQTITSVKTVNSDIDTGKQITFNYTPDVPDTKTDVSQTVYFIGLLILLAGVGIIYANVLPKKEQ